MELLHEGGCLCGEARYIVGGYPEPRGVCHCRYCQLRTGTAFGIGVYFNSEQVTFNYGATDTYSYETENGSTTELLRCTKCVTTVSWTISPGALRHMLAVAGATFDPPTFWYDVEREVFTRSKAEFCQISVPESYNESPIYNPVRRDNGRLKGGG